MAQCKHTGQQHAPALLSFSLILGILHRPHIGSTQVSDIITMGYFNKEMYGKRVVKNVYGYCFLLNHLNYLMKRTYIYDKLFFGSSLIDATYFSHLSN